MNEMEQELEELQERLSEMPLDRAALGLVNRAIYLADQLNRNEQGILLRLMRSNSHFDCAMYREIIPDIVWCQARYEEEPGRYDPEIMIVMHSAGIATLIDRPDIPRATIESLIAKLRDYYQQCGSTMREYEFETANYLHLLGEAHLSLQAFQRGMRSPRDTFSSDEEKEILSICSRYHDLKEWSKVLRGCREYLNRQGGTNHRNDAHALRMMMLPLLLEGSFKEAEECFEACVDYSRKHDILFTGISEIIQYLRLCRRDSDAVAELNNNFACYHDMLPIYQLQLMIQAWRLTARITTSELVGSVVPPAILRGTSANQFPEAFHEISKQLADAFNRRNGNTAYSRWLEQEIDYELICDSFHTKGWK